MFAVKLPWKEFRIDLSALEARMRLALGQKYAGISAHSILEICFIDTLSAEEMAHIDEYMASLSEAGEQAKIAIRERRQSAVERTKIRLVSSDLTSLSTAERKVLMGLPLSIEELDSLA